MASQIPQGGPAHNPHAHSMDGANQPKQASAKLDTAMNNLTKPIEAMGASLKGQLATIHSQLTADKTALSTLKGEKPSAKNMSEMEQIAGKVTGDMKAASLVEGQMDQLEKGMNDIVGLFQASVSTGTPSEADMTTALTSLGHRLSETTDVQTQVDDLASFASSHFPDFTPPTQGESAPR
jgi:hypothetical protein